MYRLGEFHQFEGGGRKYLYLVPSAGIFELDDACAAVIDRLRQAEGAPGELAALGDQKVVDGLRQGHPIATNGFIPPLQQLPADFPLQTLVMNLTNQCNLSCQYCYEFGEDKVATPEGKPKFMDFDTARESVDYLFVSSAGRRTIHITFFG